MSEERQRESQRSKEEAGEEREEGSEGGTEKKPEKVARNNMGALKINKGFGLYCTLTTTITRNGPK